MARITDEQKVQINELYLQIGVKSKVAKILGISPASVSKYIIPDYVSLNNRKIEKFNKNPKGFSDSFLSVENGKAFAEAMIQLSLEEKEDLKTLQKGIFL